MSFFGELKRRNVVRVGAAYVAVSWLVIQVVETLFPVFGLSDAAIRIVVILLAIGFVPAVISAWAFELTPEGFRREAEVDHDSAVIRRMTRRLDRLFLVALALALGFFVFDKFVLDPARDAEELATARQEARQEGRSDAIVESFGDKSIAVLPFVNMSSDPEQEYFADGISEELLNLLARIPTLRVISRSSAFSFKGKDVNIPEVAEQLNVAHVLEGSVRKSGNKIRITAQLIEARSDTHLWSETYDRTLDDIFAIQDDVAAAVVEQLKLALLGEAPRAERANPQAYALYIQASQLFAMANQEEYGRAEELVRQALQIDPDYVDALLLLGNLLRFSESADPGGAGAAFGRVMELDPDNAILLAFQATERWSQHEDLAGAARLLEKASRSDPYNPLVLFNIARFAKAAGRTDLAIALNEYIADRDPLFFWAHLNLASTYFVAGRVEEALRQFEAALAINPSAGAVRWKTGLARLVLGDAAGALAEFELEDPGGPYGTHGKALAYHDLGRMEEFEVAMRELEQRYPDFAARWAWGFARAHAWVGNADEAFLYLEATAEQSVGHLGGLATHPLFRKLHEDSRWEPFLLSVNQSSEQVAAVEFDVTLPD
ncbi:MAG: tetratricopeptide repeat protein [Chromatiales bacterium]|jgi:TolB-like protein/Tfp pilus assembly protein PilF|nr:tetratricopeptide repeat protein [Chromatiales bacterium]